MSEMHIPITTEHNAKSIAALPEDLSMSSQDVHPIQTQEVHSIQTQEVHPIQTQEVHPIQTQEVHSMPTAMHQLPLSLYQHSQTLYSEHVEPAGVDPGVYPSQHTLSSVSTYSYLTSSQTQPEIANNHASSNHYLASSQPQSSENMEDNPTSSHPYLSSQTHPPPQSAENMEDNPASSHPYLSTQTHPQPHVEEDHTSSSHQYSDSMLDLASAQRPESLTAKRLPDTDVAENLSLSTLYAYYSSLASQYLNMSGYPGYTQPTDDQEQSQQNV
jgi:hypothetical protein